MLASALMSGWHTVVLDSTLKIIQFGQSSVAGIDAKFDASRFEFPGLANDLPAGQVIDHQDVRLLAEFYGITHGHCTYALRQAYTRWLDTKTPLDRKGAAFIKCGVLTLDETPIGRGRRTRTGVSSLFAITLRW